MNACRISGLAPLILNLDRSGWFALVGMTVQPYIPLCIINSTSHFFSFVRIAALFG